MEFDIPLILIRAAWAGPLFTAPDIEQWPVIDPSHTPTFVSHCHELKVFQATEQTMREKYKTNTRKMRCRPDRAAIKTRS